MIQNRNHIRDRSKGIEEFKQRLISFFEDQNQAAVYFDEISQRYRRYRRDQFAIIHRVIQRYPSFIDSAISKCMTDRLFSANDFRDLAHHLHTTNHQPVQEIESHYSNLAKHTNIKASTRSLNTYTRILGGRV